MKSVICINGKTYVGNSVSVNNNVVYIDGKKIEDSTPDVKGILRVEITGDLVSVTSDAPVSVSGSVKGDVVADGPVTCGNVFGNVKADGPVNCGNVTGNVKADGPVNCGNVGSIKM